MPPGAFELRDQLGEVVIDDPPVTVFREGLIADLRALVHGRCFAGALEVALACDLIWASAGHVHRTTRGRDRRLPFAGGTQRLASQIGTARTA